MDPNKGNDIKVYKMEKLCYITFKNKTKTEVDEFLKLRNLKNDCLLAEDGDIIMM